MLTNDLREKDFEKEWIFKASRSSGPGGQNVNKVSTRMELRFSVINSKLFNDEEKEKLIKNLSRYINREGELILVSQTERSQFNNKKKVIERFYRLVEKTLAPVKRRKATRPTLSSKIRRIEHKKKISEKKTLRKINPETDQ